MAGSLSNVNAAESSPPAFLLRSYAFDRGGSRVFSSYLVERTDHHDEAVRRHATTRSLMTHQDFTGAAGLFRHLIARRELPQGDARKSARRRRPPRQRRRDRGFEWLEERRVLATVALDGFTNTLIYAETDNFAKDVTYALNLLGSDTVQYTFSTNGGTISTTVPGCVGDGTSTVDCTIDVAKVALILAGQDRLTVSTPAGRDLVSYTLGTTAAEGTLDIWRDAPAEVTRFPSTLVRLGQNGALVFNDPDGPVDTLIIEGTAADEDFRLDRLGDIGVYRVNFSDLAAPMMTAPGVSEVELRGGSGNERFLVSSQHPYGGGVFAVGGDPGYQDRLEIEGSGSADILIDLASKTVSEQGLNDIFYNSIEWITVEALEQPVIIFGTEIPETMVVDPLSYVEKSSDFQITTLDQPRFVLNGASRLQIDTRAESDRVTVNGTADAQTISVQPAFDPNYTEVTVQNFKPVWVLTSNLESLAVNGREGADFFQVVQPSLPLTIFGGVPLAVPDDFVGDVLQLSPTASPSYYPGPSSDSGAISNTTSTINFFELERLVVELPELETQGQATIYGTHADDRFSVRGQLDPFGFPVVTVTVNQGPQITFLTPQQITLQSLAGDDQIDLELGEPDVDYVVDGGLPATGNDRVRVFGVLDGAGQDGPVEWTPTSAAGGSLWVGGRDVTLAGIDVLTYIGQQGNTQLTVFGTQDPDRFIHVPGEAIDAGSISVELLLPLNYLQLGPAGSLTVIGNGLAERDVLVAYGTQSDDVVTVTVTGNNAIGLDQANSNGRRVSLSTSEIGNYELELLAGNDWSTVNGNSLNVASFSVAGGEGQNNLTLQQASATAVSIQPSSTNLLQTEISGIFSLPIFSSGNQLLNYLGMRDGAGEPVTTLTIDPGAGDNRVRVQRGTGIRQDLVLADSLPQILYSDIRTLVVNASSSAGADVVTFALGELVGAIPANYQVVGGPEDTLVIEGNEGLADQYTVVRPGSGSVRVTQSLSTPVTVTETSDNLGRLRFDTRGGDDTVTIDLQGSSLPNTPITFDGGANADTLRVTGMPLNTVRGSYRPGPATGDGRLVYEETNGTLQTLTVDFTSLASVIDSSVGTLTVFGTDASNQIDYRADNLPGFGAVSVDGFELIAFQNKSTLTIDALAGDDSIDLNYEGASAPVGLTTLAVQGGNSTTGDRVTVNGTLGADLIGFTPTGIGAASFTGVQQVNLLSVSQVELLTVNGLGDSTGAVVGDRLRVNTPVGVSSAIEITPGSQLDSGTVRVDTLLPLEFRNLSMSGLIEVIDADADDADRVIYNGTAARDAFVMPFDDPPRIPTGTPSLVRIRYIGSTPFMQTPVSSAGIENYTVRGLGGSDLFDVSPMVDPTSLEKVHIRIEGGSATGESSVLNYLAQPAPAGAVTHDFHAATIQQVDFGDVVYSGISQIHLNLSGQAFAVQGTPQDDTVTVTPTGSSAAEIAFGSRLPRLQATAVGTLNVDTLAGQNMVIVQGSPGSDHFVASRTQVSITTPSRLPVNYTASGGTNSLSLLGLGADDRFTFELTDGLHLPVWIDGGTGADSLEVIAAPDISPVASVTFYPGPENSGGRLDYFQPSRPKAEEIPASIQFTHLEPILDLVPASNLVVQGTNANNSINYRVGANVTRGLVSVDGFETLEFSFKDQLTINGLAGDDTIQLNNPHLPTGNLLPSLNVITIHGDDATLGDRVIINGTVATDTLDYRIMGVDAADVVGVQAATRVELRTVESVTVNGQLGGDNLTISTPAGPQQVIYTPGTARDAGEVLVEGGLPLSFVNLGTTGALTISDPAGRVDTLTQISSQGNDLLRVAATNGEVTLTDAAGQHIVLRTAGVRELILDGRAGDDQFFVDGLQPYQLLSIRGQEPDAGDSLQVTGTSGSENIRLLLATQTITGLSSSPTAVIQYSGITNLLIDGGAAGGLDTLLVEGTANDDRITYEPLGQQEGLLSLAGDGTNYRFNRIAGDLTLAGGSSVADQVVLLGTRNHDVITVDSVTRRATVEDALGVMLKPVLLDATVELLLVQAREGNDTIHVIPAPALANSITGLPMNLGIDVDGGAPSASDALVIADPNGNPLAATDFVVVNRSRIANQGVIRMYRDTPGSGNLPARFPDIGYVDIEVVEAKVADPAANRLIMGPDLYEQNNSRSDATFLGSGSAINVQNLAIFPPINEHRFVDSDQDWFRLVAQQTGTLDATAYFAMYSPELLPQGGDMTLNLFDRNGVQISGFGVSDTDQDARRRFPVIAGQTYYLQVIGAPTVAGNPASTVVNGYNLSIVNTPAIVPYDLELVDIVASSTVNSITSAPGAVNLVFTASASASLATTDDFYNGFDLVFTSGGQAIRSARVVDYVAASRTFTVDASLLSGQPAGGDAFQVESSDTGRTQWDNVTRDATPLIRFRLDDGIFLNDLPGNSSSDAPPDEVIPIPFNAAQTGSTTTAGYRVAIFIEGPPQSTSGILPQVPVGYARKLADGVYEFDFGLDAIGGPFSLASLNGSYMISARVEMDDPATPIQTGWGARSTSLEVIVDTLSPAVYFGQPSVANDGLAPGSDSGIENQPATFQDRITSVTRPKFWGVAEANTIIRLYADQNNNGRIDGADLLLGQTVAVPLDGTNQYPGGQWRLPIVVNLNDPANFPLGGPRTILAVAEDLAGNRTAENLIDTLQLMIDTQGPIITGVAITQVPAYDLFDPKPSAGPPTGGPTPPVTSLTVSVTDLPNRAAPGFLYEAVNTLLATTPGSIMLVGDHNGPIAIQSITFTGDPVSTGLPATGRLVLSFAQPLPDDRFTLTVKDLIRDIAGNRLDGESDTNEPEENPRFPSGDGVPGSDFVARFTVDSRPEMATSCCSGIYVDANGNFVWDPQGKDNDATNRDLTFQFAASHESVFAGNFSPAGATQASGFDKLGAYGVAAGSYRFLLDFDHDGVSDFSSISAFQINAWPIAGNFSPTHPGDEIGLFDGVRWYLDSNGNNVLELTDTVITGTLRGLPIVGDFNGDGQDDFGTYQAGIDTFFLDYNRDGNADATVVFGFSGIHERPITGDLNLDGVDDLGLWVPYRSGQIPEEAAEWFFLISDSPTGLFLPYSPAPLGNDLFAQFGFDAALPVFGNFDPPVATPAVDPGSQGNGSLPAINSRNPANRFDTNVDGVVSAQDALIIINHLNRMPSSLAIRYLDVSGDSFITGLDVLQVINRLNATAVPSRGEGEGEDAELLLRHASGLAAQTEFAWLEPSAAWADAVGNVALRSALASERSAGPEVRVQVPQTNPPSRTDRSWDRVALAARVSADVGTPWTMAGSGAPIEAGSASVDQVVPLVESDFSGDLETLIDELARIRVGR